jgi:hypothetical protein
VIKLETKPTNLTPLKLISIQIYMWNERKQIKLAIHTKRKMMMGAMRNNSLMTHSMDLKIPLIIPHLVLQTSDDQSGSRNKQRNFNLSEWTKHTEQPMEPLIHHRELGTTQSPGMALFAPKKTNASTIAAKGRITYYSYYHFLVDDALICGTSQTAIADFANHPRKKFEPAERFLGLTIDRNRNKKELSISQPDYVDSLIKKFRLQNCHPRRTPAEPGQRLCSEIEPKNEKDRILDTPTR